MFRNPLEEQGGEGLFAPHYAFPKKMLSPCTTCPQQAHVHQWHIVCRNASRALRGVLLLRVPKQRGAKSELAPSTLPFRGPKSGRKCYITPAFSGVPYKGDKIKASPKEGGNATSPLHSRGSPTKGTKSKNKKKTTEKPKKKFSTASLTLPGVLHGAPTGD